MTTTRDRGQPHPHQPGLPQGRRRHGHLGPTGVQDGPRRQRLRTSTLVPRGRLGGVRLPVVPSLHGQSAGCGTQRGGSHRRRAALHVHHRGRRQEDSGCSHHQGPRRGVRSGPARHRRPLDAQVRCTDAGRRRSRPADGGVVWAVAVRRSAQLHGRRQSSSTAGHTHCEHSAERGTRDPRSNTGDAAATVRSQQQLAGA